MKNNRKSGIAWENINMKDMSIRSLKKEKYNELWGFQCLKWIQLTVEQFLFLHGCVTKEAGGTN
jgi:hypothetical protein